MPPPLINSSHPRTPSHHGATLRPPEMPNPAMAPRRSPKKSAHPPEERCSSRPASLRIKPYIPKIHGAKSTGTKTPGSGPSQGPVPRPHKSSAGSGPQYQGPFRQQTSTPDANLLSSFSLLVEYTKAPPPLTTTSNSLAPPDSSTPPCPSLPLIRSPFLPQTQLRFSWPPLSRSPR